MIQITTQEQLDSLVKESNDNIIDCFVRLNGGLRSSKDISINDDGSYYVYNEIDDTEEIIGHKDFTNSFIGKAMSNGALFKY